VAWLAVACSKTAVCQLMRIAWRTVGAMVARVWADTDKRIDRLAGLRRIGIDEISYKRHHNYITVVVDHDSGRLIWAAAAPCPAEPTDGSVSRATFRRHRTCAVIRPTFAVFQLADTPQSSGAHGSWSPLPMGLPGMVAMGSSRWRCTAPTCMCIRRRLGRRWPPSTGRWALTPRRIVQLPQLIVQLTPLLVESKGSGAVWGCCRLGCSLHRRTVQNLPLESQGRGRWNLGVLILEVRGEVIVRDGFLGGRRSHHCGCLVKTGADSVLPHLRWELEQVMSRVRPEDLSAAEIAALLAILMPAHSRVIGGPTGRAGLRVLGISGKHPAPKLANSESMDTLVTSPVSVISSTTPNSVLDR
jgi:hypothetical protein